VHPDRPAGAALLVALEAEFRDKRTWETLYKMIMALGASGYVDALPILLGLCDRDLEFMVTLALGDAIVRLGGVQNGDAAPLINLLATGNAAAIEGGLRAVAILRLRLPVEEVRQIVQFVSQPANHRARFWAAAAAADWPREVITDFLQDCTHDAFESTRRAARAALQGKYLSWRVL
jgi:hypothetical protein